LDNFFKNFNSSLTMIEEKINFLFTLIEIVFWLIVLLIIIWVYGFVRKNLGLDSQTKELKKIREIMEEKFKK
jgi:type II secretory pathway component PulF